MPKSLEPSGLAGPKVRVILLDSTTGGGKTSLTNASSGLNVAVIADNEATTTAYTAAGSTIDSVTTLGTWAAPTSAHCRFKEVDATNHPGLYELQFEASRWAVSGARKVVGTVKVTGAVTQNFEVQLTGMDLGVGIDVQTIKGQTLTCSAAVTVGPNVGTAQPINFTGASSSALVKTDMIDINSSPAQGIGGTAQDGSTNSITLQHNDPFGTANLIGWRIKTTGGAGAGQFFTVTSQSGTSSDRVLTTTATLTALDSTTTYDPPYPPADSGATDPWSVSLPGSYASGTAGQILGHNLDAQVSTRSTFAGGAVASVTAPVTAGTVTDKTGYALTGAYDPAKTAAQAGNAMALTPGERTALSGVILSDTSDTLGADILAIKVVTDKLATAVQSDGSGGWQFTVLALAHAPSGGGGSDPWSTAEPGSYASGTFGHLVASVLGNPLVLGAAGLDAIVIESGVNARQALSPILAAAAGVVSGAGTGTIIIKGGNVTTTRITAVTDGAGNRTSVTLAIPS